MRVDSETSIQKIDSDDSIVACRQDAADFFDSIDSKQKSRLLMKQKSHLLMRTDDRTNLSGVIRLRVGTR